MEWMGSEPTGTMDAWMQQWVEGFLQVGGVAFALAVLGLVLLTVLGAWGAKVVRRHFWCRVAQREVDVEFQPRIASLKSCSAFQPATAISCARQCLDPRFREDRIAPELMVAGDDRAPSHSPGASRLGRL